MSISSPQTGGSRRPSSRPAAGAKPARKSTPSPKSAEGQTDTSSEASEGKTGAGSAGKTTGKTGTGRSAAKSAAAAKSTASTKSTAAAKSAGAAGRSATKAATPAKTGGKGGGSRPPITPVKVSQGRNWGPIMLSTFVALLAIGIVGFGVYQVFKSDETWQDRANGISGIANYTKSDPALVKSGQHQYGHIDYKQSPPVAGPHNYNWQRCQGDVYPEPIANEHAVHALEHGAVWITYRPDLPKSQVDKLAAKVRGNDYLFMSPYPGLDKPISLQAWGYQLKVDNADDGRIGDFIKDLRQNATQEPGAACSTASGNYITSTGTKPHDLGSPAPSAPSS